MREQWTTGSVEEEARRLVDAAGDWLRTHQGPVDRERAAEDAEPGVAPGADPGPGHQAGATCQGCPWCRAKAALGGPAGADTLESLADLLSSAAESLRLFAQSRRQDEPAAPEREGEP